MQISQLPDKNMPAFAPDKEIASGKIFLLKIGFFLWMAIVLVAYFSHHPPVLPGCEFTLPQWLRLAQVAKGLSFLFLIYWAGFGLLTMLRRYFSDPAENLMAALIFGAFPAGSLWALITGGFIAWKFGFTFRPFIAFFNLLMIPAFVGLYYFPWRKAISNLKSIPVDKWAVVYCLGLFLLSCLSLYPVMAPALAFDDLSYHLVIPKLFHQHGTISHLPELPLSNRPLSLHLLYSWIWTPLSDIAVRSFTWGIVLLSSLFLYYGTRRLWGNPAGMIAGLALIGNPELGLLSQTALTDPIIVLCVVLGIFLLRELAVNPTLPALLAIGSLSALLPGLKYTGLLIAFGLMLVATFLWLYKSRKIIPLLCVILVSTVLASPWYIKNWIETGNPVSPHLASWWKAPDSYRVHTKLFLSHFKTAMPFGYDSHLLLRRFGMGREPLDILMLPWNATIYGQFHTLKYSLLHFDGVIGFLPLLFLPGILLLLRWQRDIFPLTVFFAALLLFLFWASGSHQIRHLLPGVSLWYILIAWFCRKSDIPKWIIAVLAVLTIMNAASQSIAKNSRCYKVVSGGTSDRAFLKKYLPFIDAFDAAAKLTPKTGRLLPLFEERTYYLNRPFYWLELVPAPFFSALMVASDAADVTLFLRKLDISCIFIPRYGMNILKKFHGPPKYYKNLQQFFTRELVPVFQDRDGILYQLATCSKLSQ